MRQNRSICYTRREKGFPNREEICAVLSINYMISSSNLSNANCYYSVDSYQSNECIRNALEKNCFINIAQSWNFNDNEVAYKSGKAYKMHIVINHLNKAFKQYLNKKPIKCCFKWGCRCHSKAGYLYQFDLYFDKKGIPELGIEGNFFFGFV